MEKDILDYLHEQIQLFNLNEEEKKAIIEYIELIDKQSSGIYKFIKSDKNKALIVKNLEEFIRAGSK